MSSLLRATALGLALIGLAGCTSKPVLNPSEQLVANHGYSQSQVQLAILKGIANRGWTAQKLAPGLIQADILVRGTHYAAVDIHYSASEYRISYRDSREMDYKNGSIHRNYNRWVANLDKNILRELNNLATDNIMRQSATTQN
ncbi:putative lipoprotein [Pseudomonas reidholzensis]|uniref:Putative lipoprotein n=1 Tax=Pseudomonas reidholzensis TaxID=1785162 RepID=A0A383S0Z9_9PSED|nr:hypothetical protein [Pseudomonas reidholzensis]SYX93017.1 putative lipoprotein [Pseudomonas reidholzensis]